MNAMVPYDDRDETRIRHDSSTSSYHHDQQQFADGMMLPGKMEGTPDNRLRHSGTNFRDEVVELQIPPEMPRRNSRFSLASSRAATPAGLRELKEEQREGDVITKVETPEWIELMLAATGISYLTFRIDQERERRAEQFYMNPFPTTFGIVTSMKFEVVVACAILVNCVLIGWEASLEDDRLEDFFSVCEHMFVAFFFIEWCLRVMAFGWVWIFELLNFCDTVLVFGTGVLFKWVMEPLDLDISYLRIFTVLRALRLARLAKSVRLMPFFKELWILIHGLTNSARPLLWTFVIALIILYVFAVAATELIGRRQVFKEVDVVQERFGNLMRSTFTMFQLMTMDTWGFDIARPVMELEPELALFFVAFIGIAVFIFWNLITAIIVENAFSIASEDSAHQAKEVELQKKRELKVLADLFLEIDKDGSGELNEEEFWGALKNKKVRQMIDLMELKSSELEEVWKTLDDGDGVLTIKEFTNGIRRMKGEAKAKDVIDTVKRLRNTSLGYTELRAQVDQFGATLTSLESDVRRISKDTGEVVGLFQEMYHRLTVHIERTERADKVLQKQKEKAARLQEMAAEAAEDNEEEDVDVD
eukprot:CAMPEP_0171101336 /NCGR_PEP_ID=MMETSP0766_2-20121228/54687_1 /TAXON_ID=439317 /ORGANISM="Gambierdiscus australes, Strain CAWD 149" /LENGTH=588 /DNA_ID=CAMNT_0011561365 /DNA_START=87 /DNA_END=1853 /DNA_ORIENTATION=+